MTKQSQSPAVVKFILLKLSYSNNLNKELKMNMTLVILCLFAGVGYASVIVDWLIALYYNVVVAQCLFYFFASMNSELPWSSCNNTWNTENCAWNSKLSCTTIPRFPNISTRYGTP